MYSIGIIVFLGISAAVPGEPKLDEDKVASLIRDCAKENNVAPGDLMNIEESFKNPSDDVLCFMKCVATKDGSLDKDGKIMEEDLDVFLSTLSLPDKLAEQVKACALNVPAIKECKDMKALTDCFPEIS